MKTIKTAGYEKIARMTPSEQKEMMEQRARQVAPTTPVPANMIGQQMQQPQGGPQATGPQAPQPTPAATKPQQPVQAVKPLPQQSTLQNPVQMQPDNKTPGTEVTPVTQQLDQLEMAARGIAIPALNTPGEKMKARDVANKLQALVNSLYSKASDV